MGEDPDKPSLLAFLEQYEKDRKAGCVRTVREYMDEFPGDDDGIAAAFTDLQRQDQDEHHVADSETIGPYHIESELGRGGQGVVYKATDRRVGRTVALKMLHGLGSGSEEVMLRFKREATVASRLDDPGICAVYDTGVENGVPYIAMRYLEGSSVAHMISTRKESRGHDGCLIFSESDDAGAGGEGSGPDTDAEPAPGREDVLKVVAFFERVARSLDTAHEAGVIHRDMKPGNIMVTGRGDPVIMDFGLARGEDLDLEPLTRTGEFFGTPAYMSPEQLLAQRVRLDRRTDVWSMGVSLYECLTLRRPFEAPTRDGLYQAIQTKDPEDPNALNPNLPRDLVTVVLTALEKDRDRRYQTARDLAEDLRRVREFEPIHARPITRWVRVKRWAQRNRALATAVAASAVILVAGTIVTTVFAVKAREQAEQKGLALAERTTALEHEAASFAKYRQTSDLALLRYLMAEADELWPRREEKIPEMEAWLGQARELRDRIERRIDDLSVLRQRAREPTDEDREEGDRRRRERYPGLFEELASAEQAISELKQRLARTTRERRRERIDESVVEAQDALTALQEDRRLTERQVWRFDDPEDEQIHRALSELERRREAFQERIADVEQRVDFSLRIREKSITEHQETWDLCRRDLATSERYDKLEMKPQIGLVPLGKDADSGFWEFWHIGSGERPVWEGTPLSGKVKIDERSGIVLVLLPGGLFRMGAQTEDASKPNQDFQSRNDEAPVHEVKLAPFFMGKHEATQGQWKRLMQANPSLYLPDQRNQDHRVTLLNPVEQVTWYDASSFVNRVDLLLPTEAQWEYAARGDTGSPWWTGKDKASLNGKVNLADTAGADAGLTRFEADLTDGYVGHAAVGSFPANAFGLHEVLGNVWEWCRDGYGAYTLPVDTRDGLRHARAARVRVNRGGSFYHTAELCRSAYRDRDAPDIRFNNLGFRPSRRIDP